MDEFKQLMNKHFTMEIAETGSAPLSTEEKKYYMSLIAFQDDQEDITIR